MVNCMRPAYVCSWEHAAEAFTFQKFKDEDKLRREDRLEA